MAFLLYSKITDTGPDITGGGLRTLSTRSLKAASLRETDRNTGNYVWQLRHIWRTLGKRYLYVISPERLLVIAGPAHEQRMTGTDHNCLFGCAAYNHIW